jgi:phospholipase/carboxylesterase
MPTERVHWGGLATYVVHELDEREQPALAVVLCHGYGAPATDLVGLAQPALLTGQFAAGQGGGPKVAFIFPGAPLDLTDQGLPGGSAWWHIDRDRLINRRTPELMAQFRRACPPGLPEARDRLVHLLAEAGKRFGLPADRFVLGGFSQGSMLATDVALRMKKPPAGLCILSGALINEDEWRPLAQERGALPVFQSHGRYDSILPFQMGQALHELLGQGRGEAEFFPFDGDHEINLDVLREMTRFLRRLDRESYDT